MTSLAERYQAGEREAVWRAIHGGQVPLGDATAVAILAMEQVSRSIDIIIERLEDAGWTWAFPMAPRREFPTAEDLDAVELLEERVGPLPVVLRACLLEVGGVFLGGTLPDWSFTTDAELRGHPRKELIYSDPLSLPTASRLCEQMSAVRAKELKGTWCWTFSGDYVQKAGVSGGVDSLQMPCNGADPYLHHAQRSLIKLTDYLRVTLRYGGFPGFEFAASIPDLIHRLAEDLSPI